MEPLLLDEIPTENLTAAELVCGPLSSDTGPCIFDFIATLDSDVAMETESARASAQRSKRQAGTNMMEPVLILI